MGGSRWKGVEGKGEGGVGLGCEVKSSVTRRQSHYNLIPALEKKT